MRQKFEIETRVQLALMQKMIADKKEAAGAAGESTGLVCNAYCVLRIAYWWSDVHCVLRIVYCVLSEN